MLRLAACPGQFTRSLTTSCAAATSRAIRSEPIGYIVLPNHVKYDTGLALQSQLVQRRHRWNAQLKQDPAQASEPLDIIVFLQHTPTFTAGRRIRGATGEAERLNAAGADYVETMRGGQVTFHGPGQLVAYPILDVRDYKLSVRCYVSRLEKTVIDTCKQFGVNTNTTKHTGVWVGEDHKIAAFGVHVQRYVTSHGLALNCNVDLDWYSKIIPCGLPEKQVTSLSDQLGRSVPVDETVPAMVRSFETLFGKPLVPVALEDLSLLD
ncbi:lipoyltransferase [Hesseltinella vesiculosa]|uniref:lipoyl(octanoyl) transferase n=1 Tax=Hesseltinella vesiculosa TaxID=101127 RepID=A0A1X2G414_9FUNG|nr:lipoyltransferase [Hesseltinella vesiculosa]